MLGGLLVTPLEPVEAPGPAATGPSRGDSQSQGCPNSGGVSGRPPQQPWGLLPTGLVTHCGTTWGQRDGYGLCGGGRDCGGRHKCGKQHKRGQLCVKRNNNGSPQRDRLLWPCSWVRGLFLLCTGWGGEGG